MKSLMRLVLVMAIGVAAGLTATPGTAEATIAEEVPLNTGNFSADNEGYVKIGKHFEKAHVDMNIGSVRLCGSFPFYYPCVDIDYWVPKWMSEVAIMTRPQAGSGVPNEAGKGRFFMDARVKAIWTGPSPNDADISDAFLMPCTRNNL